MATATDADKAAERHPYGPRPIAALLPALTRTAFRRRSPAAARLLADWEAIVGPSLAAVTVPERCAAGTLSLACAGPLALELQHLAPKLIERINTHVGRELVTRIRFHQTRLPARGAAPARTPRRVEAEVGAALAARLAGVPQGALRDALAALARAIESAEPIPPDGDLLAINVASGGIAKRPAKP
jgi:hypothetical protein